MRTPEDRRTGGGDRGKEGERKEFMENFGKCMSKFDSEVRRNQLRRVVLNGLFSLVPSYVTPLWPVFGCLKLFVRRGRDSGEKMQCL